MSRIFISYRRKSWPFTHRLAEELSQRLSAEIFVDFTGVDETVFERAILRNLRASDAVLLVISEHTFADRVHRDDDWVRREIREALVHQIPLILVCVEGLLPPPGLPEDIKEVARMQGINFYPEYFAAAVDRLAEFVVKIGAAGWRAVPVEPLPSAGEEKQIGGRATLDDALDLLQAGDYHKAIFLLESLLQAGYASRYVDIEAVLVQARQEAEQADARRQAALGYDEIAALARRKVTEAHARAAFAAWCKDYPAWVDELDTQKLRERFRSEAPAPKGKKPRLSRVVDLLPPPFEWIDIPAGRVELEGGHGAFDVPAFQIAKYPLTNAQYAQFIEAGGYREKQWWTAAGWEAHEQGLDWNARKKEWRPTGKPWTEPRFWKDKRWNGAEYPVVGVSWYEAVAFCRWLAEVSGEPVMLPTEQQWQRAAQGDEGYVYPWGNEWDGTRCNNTVKPHKSNQTTPVTQYPKGASPFGVMDMSGNVWEWCLNDYRQPRTIDVNTQAEYRVLRGGSWSNINTDIFRVANRDWADPRSRNYNGGFRCARSR